VAAVSYLNTLPLIEGVAKLDRVRLHLTAPADLIGLLEDGTVDVALASSIDYQRSTEELGLLPCGVIASDGPTFTVRVFSREPIESVRTVHADVESHTSVTLLRVLMKRLHGVDVEIEPFTAPAEGAGGAESDWPPAVLLIGDKVVSGAPPAAVYPHQLDLGDAWHGLTGLPFVYATWMVRLADAESNPALLAHAGTLLDRQRRHNATRLSWIAATHAARHGWPVETAVKYLTEYLSYGLTERHAAGLERFFEMAGEQGLIDTVRPVRWVAAESLTW
jgi:chorismate dehydratase